MSRLLTYGIIQQGTTPSTRFEGALALYSLRLLGYNYSGNCVKVRRSSDNTTSDIGFAGGVIDTSALLTFCGAGHGYVERWYDQSGNGLDAVQLTTTRQPQIVSSGNAITENNKSTLLFSGAHYMSSGNYSIGATNYSIFIVAKYESIEAEGRAVFSIMPSGGNANGWFHALIRNNITNYFRCWHSSNGASVNGVNLYPSSGFILNVLKLVSFCAGSAARFYINSVLQSSYLIVQATQNNAQMWIGHYYFSGQYRHSGKISEIIVYPSDKVEDRINIENNINTFYQMF